MSDSLEVKKKSRLSQKDGQATIEFLVVLSFALGIIFLFLVMSLNSGTGYLVHYVNFMASRTFLTADNGSNEVESAEDYAERQAKEVVKAFELEKFGLKNMADKMKFNRTTNPIFEYVGTYYTFAARLSIFASIAGGSSAELTTESFLGREPPRVDCLERICNRLEGLYSCTEFTTAFDDGC